jgi:hypothetical protein
MKIKEISLSNFANYEKIDVSLNSDVTYLIGKNGSGKSTIGITAIWFILQGIAEKSSAGTNPLIGERFRFIGPKGATAKGTMTLLDEKTGAEIIVSRKLTKTGSELSFNGPDTYEFSQQWLNDLFNVFMISPKAFTELSGIQQAKAIGIDTSSIDADIVQLKEKAKVIRIELKQYDGLVVEEKTEPVKVEELQAKKLELKKAFDAKLQENKTINRTTRTAWEEEKKKIDDDIQKFRIEQINIVAAHNDCAKAFETLVINGYEGQEVPVLIQGIASKIKKPRIAADEYPAEPTDLSTVEEGYTPAEGEKVYIIEMPDATELEAIDQQIIDATETNRKAMLYSQYLLKKDAKEKKEKELADNLQAQSNKADERIKYIQGLKLPFSNLTIDEDGQLLLQDKTQQFKPIKEPYFSTGEILKIVPILITHKNPELKYVFVQGFRDLDDDNWAQVEKYLLDKGFQIVVEVVSKEKIVGKNCILLKDNVIVDSYDEVQAPKLV